jgi:hypothetical protein
MTGGPVLLLDKCGLQGLSATEVASLPRCLTVNLPAILTLEILGDLKRRRAGKAQRPVQSLADKLIGLFDHENNVHYRLMMEGELVGHTVPMNGVPIISGARKIPASSLSEWNLTLSVEESK